jgi:hypothetical protein
MRGRMRHLWRIHDDDDYGLNLFDFWEEIRLWGRISGCNELLNYFEKCPSVHRTSLFPTPSSITLKVRRKVYTELLFFLFHAESSVSASEWWCCYCA